MITEKQIQEIREHLENAKNPIFFFDNDVDGLCSFLILRRFLGRGRGVAVKGYPGLDKKYFNKIEEMNADYIFILDEPVTTQDFIDEAKEKNITIVYIDHHNVEKPKIENYYNTFYESGKIEPVSYMCYKITKRKEDEWLAVVGSIADAFIPEFLDDFKKSNPDLIDCSYKTAFDVYYNSIIGKIARIFAFGLLDKTSNVVSMMKYIINSTNAHDVLEETKETKSFIKRYEEIDKKIKNLIEKAEEHIDKKNKVLFFTYAGEMSVSQEFSNELMYKHKDIVIVVGFTRGVVLNFSFRSWDKDVRKIVLNSIKDIQGAMGGGHEHSAGARIPHDSLDVFKENVLREIRNQ